jgi:molybdenum cofactor sulfurtransferase
VDVVQVPGQAFGMSALIHERFEARTLRVLTSLLIDASPQDGSVNYLSFPAIVDGLRLHSLYLPFLPSRLSALTHYLESYLASLKHASTGMTAVKVLSARPQSCVRKIGDQSDTGSTISFLFLDVRIGRICLVSN